MALRIACVWTPVDYFAGSVVCHCSRTHSAANPAVRDMRVHACRIGMHAEPREHRFSRQWMQLQTYDPRNMLAMLCKVASFTVPLTGITPAGTSSLQASIARLRARLHVNYAESGLPQHAYLKA